MRKNEIPFFLIDNFYYGGDQNWHDKCFARLGGCSTVCACETCISLARDFVEMRALYPFDCFNITREDFLCFFDLVNNFIYPGLGGLSKISRFERMLNDYICYVKAPASINILEGYENYKSAQDFIIESIDNGLPVMCLLLMHKNMEFEKYEWHWFNITGYEIEPTDFHIKAATWGEVHKLNFNRMWDTGRSKKGGLVRLLPDISSINIH